MQIDCKQKLKFRAISFRFLLFTMPQQSLTRIFTRMKLYRFIVILTFSVSPSEIFSLHNAVSTNKTFVNTSSQVDSSIIDHAVPIVHYTHCVRHANLLFKIDDLCILPTVTPTKRVISDRYLPAIIYRMLNPGSGQANFRSKMESSSDPKKAACAKFSNWFLAFLNLYFLVSYKTLNCFAYLSDYHSDVRWPIIIRFVHRQETSLLNA